jgi:hypothetical protein
MSRILEALPPKPGPYIFDWRDFEPLARVEAGKFWRKQERGRFQYKELLSVAVEALARSKGVNHARKAIKGALLDFARDGHKLVPDVEMIEDKFKRTWGEPDEPTQGPVRVYYENGVRVTVCPTAKYRTNAELLAGTGKADPKHGKVRIALGRSTYNDGWNQQIGGQLRAKVVADKQQKADPKHHKQAPGSVALFLDTPEGKPPPEDEVGQADYRGHGRKQRFSGACHNHGKDFKHGLSTIGIAVGIQQFGGNVVVNRIAQSGGRHRLQREPQVPIRRIAVPPWPTWAEMFPGKRTLKNVTVDLTKFGLGRHRDDGKKVSIAELVELGVWQFHSARPRDITTKALSVDNQMELGLPKHPTVLDSLLKLGLAPRGPRSASWQRAAGYFQVNWGLPFGSLMRKDGYFYRPEKIFSAAIPKSHDRADVIYEGAIPSRVPARLRLPVGGSSGGGAILLPPDVERAVAGAQSAADGAAHFSYPPPSLENARASARTPP